MGVDIISLYNFDIFIGRFQQLQ